MLSRKRLKHKEMNSQDITNKLIQDAKSLKKNVLLIFTGDNCRWCAKLKDYLKAGALQSYCTSKDLEFAWVTLAPKPQEEAEACNSNACKTTTRNRFNIKSIPTAVLYDTTTNEVIATTEYIDSVETLGEVAYITWIEENLLF